VITLIGFIGLARYVPPPLAALSADQLAEFYRSHAGSARLGITVTFIGFGGWGFLAAIITSRMLKMKPRNPALVFGQLAAGAAGWAFLNIAAMCLIVAAFRPEREPEITQAVHDIGWMCIFMSCVPFIMQALFLGIAILQDKSASPALPRWAGYLSLWYFVALAPGAVVGLFKTGPLAYDGLFGFWIPILVFVLWWIAIGLATARVASKETPSEEELTAIR
jgi:hypothetical protein